MWVAIAEYVDGTRIEKRFPYLEDGNWLMESERQYQLEEWLLTQKENCTWYSVGYEEEEEE